MQPIVISVVARRVTISFLRRMFPIRCYSCNAVLAQHWIFYSTGIQTRHPRSVLDEINISRMCCRRMFLSHADMTNEQHQFSNVDSSLDSNGTKMYRQVHRDRVYVCD